jgi:non-specific protein-tyrosine kinase
LDLRRQIAIVRSWFPLLVASTILPAILAFAVSGVLPKTYEAKETLIVGQSLSAVNTAYDQLLASQQLATTYATVATTRPVLVSVITQLNLNVAPEDLLKRVSADAAAASTLLTITVQDPDANRAAAIANAMGTQLISASPAIRGQQAFQDSIDSDLAATQAQIDSTQQEVATLTAIKDQTAAQQLELTTLEDRLASLQATYATLLGFSSSASNLITVVEPATAPDQPISPRPALNAILAGVLGLMIALGLVILWVYFDDAIKDPDEVQEVAGLPTLGTIPRMKSAKGSSEMYRLATLVYPQSGVAEAYRTLRVNIEFASVGTPVQTLLVTSAVSGEGKTITATNLAVVFASSGRRVLLVDADLRRPGVHLVFNTTNGQGLTSLLRSDDVSLDAVARVTEQANLRILTAGPLPPNPAELLGSPRMQVILDRLKASGDLIIFDSPPLQGVTDSTVLSSFLDGTVMVIDAGRGKRRAVRLGRDALNRAGAKVLGAVLNRIPVRSPTDAVYYGGVYGQEEGSDARARDTKARPQGSAS